MLLSPPVFPVVTVYIPLFQNNNVHKLMALYFLPAMYAVFFCFLLFFSIVCVKKAFYHILE